MSNSLVDDFSETIATLFADFGVNPPFIETILLQDRRYVGRKYKAGGYQVVWWIEKGSIEIFDEDGQSVRVVAIRKPHEKIA
jgi:hypothetical protein